MWRVIVLSRQARAALILGLACVALALGVIAWQVLLSDPLLYRAVTGTPRRLPIYSVARDDKVVAVSFDAAWGAQYTPDILGTLRQRGIKTTFFLVGFWMEKYPDVTRTIAAEGHELANHTATHPHLNSLSKEQIKQELLGPHHQIVALTGQNPFLFRPPFGEYSDKVIEAAEELGYYTIQWDVDSLDWRDVTPDEIYTRVTSQIRPGSIVLFHNNATNTPAALPRILDWLAAQGYRVVPVSEIIYRDNWYIDHEGAQHQRGKSQTGEIVQPDRPVFEIPRRMAPIGQ